MDDSGSSRAELSQGAGPVQQAKDDIINCRIPCARDTLHPVHNSVGMHACNPRFKGPARAFSPDLGVNHCAM